MAFLRQWLLILFALGLGGGQIMAAGGRENRAYAAAAAVFQDGMYGRAETAFAQFVEKYPKSERVGEAILLQAQAEIKLGDFTNAVARLANPDNQARAGSLADEYVYWTGEAQFQSADYSAAAETWIALAQKFPESRRRLEAMVDVASAYKELAEWQQTVALLGTTNGVFQRLAQADPDGELVAGGKLFLAQAKFALKDFSGAAAILEPLLDSPALKPELRRQCGLLLYQVKVTANELAAALAVTTNLLQIAQLETNADLARRKLGLARGALEKLGRTNDAIAAYQENANVTNTPPDRQREAILKIARTGRRAKRLHRSPRTRWKDILAQFTRFAGAGRHAADAGRAALETLCTTQPAATNELAGALARFDQFIGTFTNSPLLGKAYLDRGWCGWLAAKSAEASGDVITAAQNYTNSFEDFKTAAQKIAALNQPPSEDLLVAWFKMGDVQFALGDFTNALENYRAVLDSLELFPEASATLGDRGAVSRVARQRENERHGGCDEPAGATAGEISRRRAGAGRRAAGRGKPDGYDPAGERAGVAGKF